MQNISRPNFFVISAKNKEQMKTKKKNNTTGQKPMPVREPSKPKKSIREPEVVKHPQRQGYHGTDDEKTLNPEE